MKDTGKARLPGLVSPKVDNADLARWVQAVSERLEVREGSRGNPYERAVTVRDLTEGGIAVMGGGGRIAAGGPGGGAYAGYTNQNPDYEKFWEELKNSSLYRELMKRIDDPTRFDDLADEIKAVLLRDIAEEARLRGADIRRLDTKIQSESRALAMSVLEVTAAVQDAAAGVRQTQLAQASATQAIAGQITQVQSKLDDKVATVEQTLKTTVDDVDGIKAEYFVKVGAGGAFGGFGLSAVSTADPSNPAYKPTYSQFLVAADKFAIVSPDGSTNPFGIDPSGIYLNGQVRINANGQQLADLTNEFYLTASGQVFNQNPNTSALSPSSITVTANLKGAIAGKVATFSSTPSGLVTANGNTATVASSAFATNTSVKVTASLSHNGVTYTDEFTLYKVVDGADALVGFLTNESHALAADSAGLVSSYTGASGKFVVFKGGAEQISGVSYSVVPGSALTATIGASGQFAVSGGLTADVATVTFRATVGGQAIDKVFTLARQKAGAAGNYTDYIFIRSTSAPGTPVGATPSGWSDTPPPGTDPLYMSQAMKKANGTLVGSWSTPVRLDGKPGTDGKYTVYQYTTGTETSATGNWGSTPPTLSAGQYMWMRAGTVTPPSPDTAWGTPYRISGEKGQDGPRGSLTGYGGASNGLWLNGFDWNSAATVNGRQAAGVVALMLGLDLGAYYNLTSHLRIGDTVTLVSQDQTRAETRYWSGTGWLKPGVTIDGNLLVKGTVSADKINTDQLFASQALINKIQTTELNASKITSGTISADRIGAITISASQITSGALSVDRIGSGVNTANAGFSFGFGAGSQVGNFNGAGFFKSNTTATFGLAAVNSAGGVALAAVVPTYGSAAEFNSGDVTGGGAWQTSAKLCSTDHRYGTRVAGSFAQGGRYAAFGLSDMAAKFIGSDGREVHILTGAHAMDISGPVRISNALSVSSLTVNGVAVTGGSNVNNVAIQPTTVTASGGITTYGNNGTTTLGSGSHVGFPLGLNTTLSAYIKQHLGVDGNVLINGALQVKGKTLAFTGAHPGVLDRADKIAVGDILVDSQVVSKLDISNTVTLVRPSSAKNQKGVIGVYSGENTTMPAALTADASIGGAPAPKFASLLATHKIVDINAVGEGQINVCGENGDLEIGDLIVSSSTQGKGMRQMKDGQVDDLVRSYTVAKCREKVTFTSPTEVKMVACIYLCG